MKYNYLLFFLICILVLSGSARGEVTSIETEVKLKLNIDAKTQLTEILLDPNYLSTQTEFILKNNEEDIGSIIFYGRFQEPLSSSIDLKKRDNTNIGVLNIEKSNENLILNKLNVEFSENNYLLFDEQESTLRIETIYLFNNEKLGYPYTLTIILKDIDFDDILTVDIMQDNVKKGSLKLEFPDISEEDFEIKKKTFQGNIYYSDGELYKKGELRVRVVGKWLPIAKEVFDNGEYGPLEAESKNIDSITFLIRNNYLKFEDNYFTLFKKFKEDQINNVDLYLAFNSEDHNYKDNDFDGIPDEVDYCPETESLIVDYQGCSCEQKECPGGSVCQEEDFYSVQLPVCRSTCNNEIKDNGEEGVDCGGYCNEECPLSCNDPNACLSDKPLYCTDNLAVMNNCQICGCPDDYSCNSDTGKCYIEVPAKGLKCKTETIIRVNNPSECQVLSESRGTTYVAEQVGNYFHFRIKGFPKFIKKKIHKTRDFIKSITFCVEQKDLGAVPLDVKCPFQDELEEYKPELQNIIHYQVNNYIKKSIPGLFRYFAKVRTYIDLTNLKIHEEYQVEPISVELDEVCKSLIKNGDPSEKADLLIIGDGFHSTKEMSEKVQEILDYEGDNESTIYEGIFSREPFKSNKDKFNIWTLNTNLDYEWDSSGLGYVPSLKSVYFSANKCPYTDYITVISNTRIFRSHCYFGTPCLNSIAWEDFKGRLFMHEFGHGFASLMDEYYEYIEPRSEESESQTLTEKVEGQINIAGTAEQIGRTKSANCAGSQQEAIKSWGDLASQIKEIDYYPTCGGVCGKMCEPFVRPTFNSIMNDHRNTCDIITSTCNYGPPFDPWYAVNTRKILKELEEYS